ncbi:hypothetical protein Tco_1034173, partial [Tanacetum coccineum]
KHHGWVDIEDLTIEQYLELTQNHSPSVVDIFNINAIADLGASVNIMSESMLEELSLADPKKANIIVEMADKTSTNDDDRISLEWEGLSCTNWVRAMYGNVNDITKEKILQKFWNNKFGGQTREKTITEEHEDPDKCGETKARAIIRAMINKLPEEWFSGVSRDLDDLEGIINYLEPKLYDGFIDHNDEAYKQRRNKLLGIPYTEPPPIIKEEAKITKYNLGDGEVFTKTKILNIKGFPKTTPNIADMRAKIINGISEDLSNTKRRHWCKPIYQWKEDTCTKWASCNPYFDECDGGDNPWENKEYWESSNDDMRTNLE